MSCCGGKRAQLSRVRRGQAAPDDHGQDDVPAAPNRTARTFEYLGRSSLTVVGAVSKRVYRFIRPGDRIEIAHDDAFAMMAERDVRPALKQ
jgi:hypothetical protein